MEKTKNIDRLDRLYGAYPDPGSDAAHQRLLGSTCALLRKIKKIKSGVIYFQKYILKF